MLRSPLKRGDCLINPGSATGKIRDSQCANKNTRATKMENLLRSQPEWKKCLGFESCVSDISLVPEDEIVPSVKSSESHDRFGAICPLGIQHLTLISEFRR